VHKIHHGILRCSYFVIHIFLGLINEWKMEYVSFFLKKRAYYTTKHYENV